MFLLSGKALSLFEQNRISGISGKERIRVLEKHNDQWIDITDDSPDYWLIELDGEAELDFSAMGLKKKHKCDYCGQFVWNRQRLYPLILDTNKWNGRDLCRIQSIPGYVVCAEKVKHLVEEHGLSGFDFTLLKDTGNREPQAKSIIRGD